MKRKGESEKRLRGHFAAGILLVVVLGAASVAWTWQQLGNNFVHTGGRVFIGVSAPTSSHVTDANAYLQVHNPESNPNNLEVARFTAKVSRDKFAYITVGDAVLDRKGTQGYLGYNPAGKKWFIGTHFYGPTMTLASTADGGYVGIGITSPTHPIHLASGAYVTSGGAWTNASSREFKEKIEELSPEKALSAFKELKPVVFNYRINKTERHLGFIAEDVPALIASEDRKGLSSMDVVALLTKVVQEQQEIVEGQRKTIAALTKRIEILEEKTVTAKKQRER
jgi:hypothetical protein